MSIVPRKGHSAIISSDYLLFGDYVNKDLIKTYNLIIFGGKTENAYLNDIAIVKIDYVVLDDNFFFKYKSLKNNKDIIGNFPEPREGHKSFIENGKLYIYGGCDYTIKKCYFDSIYMLDLTHKPYNWEKMDLSPSNLNIKEKDFKSLIGNKLRFNNMKTGEKISNILPFGNTFINIGLCNKYETCSNTFNIMIINTECFNKKLSSPTKVKNECILGNEKDDNKFNWKYECIEKRIEEKEDTIKNQRKIPDEKNDSLINEDEEKVEILKTNKRILNKNLKKIKSNDLENDKDYIDMEIQKILKKNKLNRILDLNSEGKRKNKKMKKKVKNEDKDEDNEEKNEENEEENEDEEENSSDDENEEEKNEKKSEHNFREKIINFLGIDFFEKIAENKKFDFKKLIKEKSDEESNNEKEKEKENTFNYTKFSNEILNTENKLMAKLQLNITSVLLNSTNLLANDFRIKLKDFINNSQNFTKEIIMKITNQKINKIEKDNSKLKKIVMQNDILPYIESNLSNNNKTDSDSNEINFLSIDESLLKLSQKVKQKKLDNLGIGIEENFHLTKNLQKNITEIKEIIKGEAESSSNKVNKMVKLLMDKLQSFDGEVENKLNKVDKFIANQEKFNNSTNNFFRLKAEKRNKLDTYCQCLPGFTGENCEKILNCENDCNKNGFCKYGKCFCNPGFSGNECEKKENCANNCSNNGKCYLGKCYCDYGFSGTECEQKMKCENNCSNKGLCFRGKCLCESGFTGKDCSQIAIKLNSCKNDCNKNGICKLEKCFCNPGFSGKYCEIKNKFSCPSNLDKINTENQIYKPCYDNGVCKYGMCFCFPGFKGKACDEKEICLNNCNNNGICVNGKCICNGNINTADCSNKPENKILSFKKENIKSEKDFKFYKFKQIDSNYKNLTIPEAIRKGNDEIKNYKIQRKNKKIISENEIDNEINMNNQKRNNFTYSVSKEKENIRYENYENGIYIGRDTIENILYSGIILLSIILSMIFMLWLNGKFSK